MCDSEATCGSVEFFWLFPRSDRLLSAQNSPLTPPSQDVAFQRLPTISLPTISNEPDQSTSAEFTTTTPASRTRQGGDGRRVAALKSFAAVFVAIDASPVPGNQLVRTQVLEAIDLQLLDRESSVPGRKPRSVPRPLGATAYIMIERVFAPAPDV